MGLRFVKADVDAAVAKLALPDFILKGAKEHKKAFDSAVSTYRRKSILKFERTEDEVAKDLRVEALKNALDKALEGIFPPYYQYEGAAKFKDIETIVTDVRKKLKTLTDYKFDETTYEKAKEEEKSVVPSKVIDQVKKAKKIFDDAVSKYGSAKLSFKKVDKNKQYNILSENTRSHIGWIYAANKYYAGTVGYKNLQKIADDIAETIDSLEKNKPQSAKPLSQNDSLSYREYVKPNETPKKNDAVPAIIFDAEENSYKTAYKNLLEKAQTKYEQQHKKAKDAKNTAKNAANQLLPSKLNDRFYRSAENARVLLKKFQEIEPIVIKLIAEHPKYKIALNRALKKLYNPEVVANMAAFEDELKSITRKGKYGGDLDNKFADMDSYLDGFTKEARKFISVFSSPKNSLEEYLKAINKLTKSINLLHEVDIIIQVAGKYEITEPKINEYIKQLNKISIKIAKEMKNWDKDYDEFMAVAAAYEHEHSTTQKIIKVVKILGLVAALASGAAQISATINSSGGVDVRAFGKK